MELLFLGLIGGAVVAYFVFNAFAKANKNTSNSQSVIITEKIRSVCKFITVEGDFSEIYHYENVKQKLLGFLQGKKKAIILVRAKAHVGFDLTKIQITSDSKKKIVTLSAFPQPQVLSMETDFQYYDKKEGWLNYFSSSDLTDISREAKQYIVDKVPESGLFDQARQEALQTILLMESLVQTIGWKLDYTALQIPAGAKQELLDS